MKKYLAMFVELVEFVASFISDARHIFNKTKTDRGLDWSERDIFDKTKTDMDLDWDESGARHIFDKNKTDMDLDWNEIVAGQTVVIDSTEDVVGTFSARNAQHFTLSSTGSTLSIEKGSTADSAIYSDDSTTIRFSTVDEDGGSYTIVGSESNSFTWKE